MTQLVAGKRNHIQLVMSVEPAHIRMIMSVSVVRDGSGHKLRISSSVVHSSLTNLVGMEHIQMIMLVSVVHNLLKRPVEMEH